MWHSRPRLCFLFCPEFGITGFPAVGDLGQELADVFDFGFGPNVDNATAHPDNFRSRNLPHRDIVSQSFVTDVQSPGCFASRMLIHSCSLSEIEWALSMIFSVLSSLGHEAVSGAKKHTQLRKELMEASQNIPPDANMLIFPTEPT